MVSLFGFVVPIIYLHLGALGALVIVIALAEKEALSWIRGKKETLSAKRLALFHTLVWILLFVMLGSGLVMAWPLKDYLVATPAFYVKMLFVLALLINSFFIEKFMHVSTEKSFASLSPTERLPLFISGGVSLISWVGAFVAGILMSTSHILLSWWSTLF